MIGVRGGAEAFYAYPAEPDETFEPGQQVFVVDFEPPRTVYVQRYRSFG